jgi:hypothetical protein
MGRLTGRCCNWITLVPFGHTNGEIHRGSLASNRRSPVPNRVFFTLIKCDRPLGCRRPLPPWRPLLSAIPATRPRPFRAKRRIFVGSTPQSERPDPRPFSPLRSSLSEAWLIKKSVIPMLVSIPKGSRITSIALASLPQPSGSSRAKLVETGAGRGAGIRLRGCWRRDRA